MQFMKDVIWLGTSKSDWNAFPAQIQDDAGYQLHLLQLGKEPFDSKPMTIIGVGVRELRIRDGSGAFRVIYLATLPKGIYVLHAFQKKSQTTSLRDVRLAQERFKLITR